MNAALLTLALVLQDGEDFAGALKKVQEFKSYGFTAKLEIEGLPQPVDELPAITGTYDAEKGLHYAIGELGHVARKGSKIAVCQTGGEWSSLEDLVGDQQPNGQQALALEVIRMVKPLHELLKGADKGIPEVEKGTDGDATTYSGAMSETAAKQSVPFRKHVAKVQGSKVAGTLKARVADGKLNQVVMEHKVTGTKDGTDFEVTIRWTIEVKDVDAAKSEMPEDAQKIVE